MNDNRTDGRLPHEGVFVRLGVSQIHGIGVFAQQSVPAGTDLFANDPNEICWVSSERLAHAELSSEQADLYQAFAIRRPGELGCPANFNLLTVGWYLNEPAAGEEPNTCMAKGYRIVTARNVEQGEELTISYADFNA